jgi:SAM-dependent methyltransferase
MELFDPLNKPIRKVERGRLAYYQNPADKAYWDKYWKEMICPEIYDEPLKGNLGHFERVFTKYLPRNEKILEAGCGTAKWVIALRQRGYDVEGVDWANETIERIHYSFPDIQVRVGDVCDLDVEDGTYGGYISLGVVEHRAEGPEPFLNEAFRVLKPGGIAIFTVPWFNLIRIIKARAGIFNGNDMYRLDFYQYAYRADEMKDYLLSTGFQFVYQESYNLKNGFEDELPYLYKLYTKGIIGLIIRRIVHRGNFLKQLFGHSMIYVCKKPLIVKRIYSV